MKFTFKNIGPVKRAELTLGKLTIIAGRNNTGKSYIAHTLYGFLIQFSRQQLFVQFLNRMISQHIASAKDSFFTSLHMKKEDGKIVVMQRDAENLFDDELKELTEVFCKTLHFAFSATEADFIGAGFSCENLVLPSDSKGYNPYLIQNVSSLSLSKGRFEVVIREAMESFSERDFAKQEILFFYMHQFTKMFPTALSAERMSISIFHKELETRTKEINEQAQKYTNKKGATIEDAENLLGYLKKVESYRRPIRDNIDFMRNLGTVQTHNSDYARSKLLYAIEDIVGGNYLYANDKTFFVFNSDGEEKQIPLHNASSSVQCFALLYFYLRHGVHYKGQLFIIDEPEAHMDTANQIKLARLLALCVKAGLQILITTHSDYLIKEINNLIMFSGDSEEGEEREERNYLMEKFGYSKEYFLEKGDVKAYVCENGGLTSCKVGEFGVQVPFIDETIDKISKVSDTLSLRLSRKK